MKKVCEHCNYYDRDGITLYCGDNVKLMRDILPDNSVNLTVTSPPYDPVDYDSDGNLVTYSGKGLRDYQGYTWDFASVAKELWRVTGQGGVVVWVVGDATVNGSETCSAAIQKLYFRSLGFNVHDTMIYHSDMPPLNHRRYEQKFEFMFVLVKQKIITFNPITVPVKHIRSRLQLNRTDEAK